MGPLGGFRNDNFISSESYIVRPIKWKGILSRLISCCQKISQTNLKNIVCKIKVKIFNFSLFSKSALRKIFFLIVLGLYTHKLCKNAKKHIVISFFSQIVCETAVSNQELVSWRATPNLFLIINIRPIHILKLQKMKQLYVRDKFKVSIYP